MNNKQKKREKFTMFFKYLVLINGIKKFKETNATCFNQFNSYFKLFSYTIFMKV